MTPQSRSRRRTRWCTEMNAGEIETVTLVWSDDTRPVVVDGQWERENGDVVALYTRDQLALCTALMEGEMPRGNILACRATAWLVELSSGDKKLVVWHRDALATDIVKVLVAQGHSGFFISPILAGEFIVQETEVGYIAPNDHCVMNEKGEVVVDADLPSPDKLSPNDPLLKHAGLVETPAEKEGW